MSRRQYQSAQDRATNHFPAFRARALQQIVCGAGGSGRGTLTAGKGYDDARVCC
jgi:hypothetical protein